jgi:hypothetical protein
LFDLGLLLVLGGAAMAVLPLSVSRPVSRSASFTAWDYDYDLTAPAGLIIVGVLIGVIGATKANGR